ncbi:hypothetical protein HPB52_017410 [Rhipicephalus sanguineus]|uniref:Uncharacterized protein n=1 Tax=Rhipicephalus sanguineus TaxID=34632 RepID=A0A9D4T7S9_RHISA|nr:hypothetical protein HPB52_017410 [Rhipicephalus sanguineus]
MASTSAGQAATNKARKLLATVECFKEWNEEKTDAVARHVGSHGGAGRDIRMVSGEFDGRHDWDDTKTDELSKAMSGHGLEVEEKQGSSFTLRIKDLERAKELVKNHNGEAKPLLEKAFQRLFHNKFTPPSREKDYVLVLFCGTDNDQTLSTGGNVRMLCGNFDGSYDWEDAKSDELSKVVASHGLELESKQGHEFCVKVKDLDAARSFVRRAQAVCSPCVDQ